MVAILANLSWAVKAASEYALGIEPLRSEKERTMMISAQDPHPRKTVQILDSEMSYVDTTAKDHRRSVVGGFRRAQLN